MKRVLLVLVACVALFFATRLATVRLRENFTGVGVERPSLQAQNSQPLKSPSVVTSLPPLTNLTLRPALRKIESTSTLAPPPQSIETNVAPVATTPPKKSGKPPRQDPFARVALSLVGIDPTAEEYWATAINDPTLSEHEREDLIEDLNEEGFADPKNPTIEELPLILTRLEIIEQYAPFAMDEVNARSFAEAYKDLANMYARLTAQPAQ